MTLLYDAVKSKCKKESVGKNVKCCLLNWKVVLEKELTVLGDKEVFCRVFLLILHMRA